MLCGQDGSTPLLVAVAGSHDTIVKGLLEKHADVNAMTKVCGYGPVGGGGGVLYRTGRVRAASLRSVTVRGFGESVHVSLCGDGKVRVACVNRRYRVCCNARYDVCTVDAGRDQPAAGCVLSR